jgi:CRISPR/Cas system-associated endonuclease Cas1
VDRLVLTLVNRAMLQERDFYRMEDRAGVFLQPQPLKRFFVEYEHWMLERPPEGGAGGLRWRELLKIEVEKLAGALGGGAPFVPYRWRMPDNGEGSDPCNTSSVTI